MVSWIFGPQLVGALLLIAGLIYYRFPPKHINKYYGYRMPLAMKNQQAWDEANRYSAIFLIKSSLVLIVIGIALSALFKVIIIPVKIKTILSVITFMLSGTIPAVMLMVATEKHLEKLFGDKTE